MSDNGCMAGFIISLLMTMGIIFLFIVNGTYTEPEMILTVFVAIMIVMGMVALQKQKRKKGKR